MTRHEESGEEQSPPTLERLEAAAAVVYRHMSPTAQIAWPILAKAVGCEVWVKHENHAPTGAFKVRGGLVRMERLRRERPGLAGVIAATRGNHGQSVALAARTFGLRATLVVPHGNSAEKNAAMRAFGAELVEQGDDFQAALERAREIADERGLVMLESFHPALVEGVASYGLELFRGAPELDAVYVPIGLGSGICGTMAARDALGLATEVVGVVAEGAPAYALSWAAGRPVSSEAARTFADGVAVRTPHPGAFERIRAGAARIVTVSDEEIADAIRLYFGATHSLVEGAGAAALAALLQERERMAGRRVAVVLSGGNIDLPVYRTVLDGGVPEVTAGGGFVKTA